MYNVHMYTITVSIHMYLYTFPGTLSVIVKGSIIDTTRISSYLLLWICSFYFITAAVQKRGFKMQKPLCTDFSYSFSVAITVLIQDEQYIKSKQLHYVQLDKYD